MRIRLAKKTGFCFGVKRAVAMAEEAVRGKKKKKIYSLGSVIHNRQVVEDLSHKGIKVIKNIGKIESGALIISSHGISPAVREKMLRKNVDIIDTTCPFVSNAQGIAKRLGEGGYSVVIAGDARHPEIKALVDFVPRVHGRKKVFVVGSRVDVSRLRLKHGGKIGVISQTTQATDNFLDVVKAIAETRPRELRVFNTICSDAEDRQILAKHLARTVDLMLIIGGKNSANTRRLFEVCRKVLKTSYLVETEQDLKECWFTGKDLVGVTSGASTPDWVISKVMRSIKSKFNRKGLWE